MNKLELKLICFNNFYLQIKLLKSGFIANVQMARRV